ncbi:MAG TPA: response regulator [Ktedonobacteraceae bacterium]|jgi:two-component system sensor histidine kinase/response regulator
MARIVFCEDEVLIQKLFRVMLRSTDHEIYLASDGIEGLELVERVRPDLIFTDISMPDCDGYQFADAVKARSYLAHIPIIFVSAFAQQAEMEEGFRHGGVSYIIKPFSSADLYEKIERFCNQKTPRT